MTSTTQIEPRHPNADPTVLAEMYRRMYRIRGFEQRAAKLYRDGKIPGFVHLAIGQEASAVGACFQLNDVDAITSTHRGHAHALAHGLQPGEMFAELMGRETGVCRGRGGSMHIADPGRGIFGANGIVGAGIPIAGGAALASRLKATGGVVVSFLGDGAMSTGAFHEAANLISLWNLPVVLFCENNRYSEFSTYEDQHPVEPSQRAIGYGLQFRQLNGNDVSAVNQAMAEILADVRSGGKPYLVEALTLRQGGHYEGDPQLYRKGEGADPVVADPLDVVRAQLGGHEKLIWEIDAEVERELDDAVVAALAAPFPEVESLFAGLVSGPRPALPAVKESLNVGGPQWKMFKAIGDALRKTLAEDPASFMAGIDVAKGGNVFALTRGMRDEWPDRMLDTPISETAIVGLGVGAAMAGLHPIIEIMYFDFIGVCLDQIMNQAAKLPYMTGGRTPMNLTIRTQFGAGKSSGAQHSQSLEAMMAHIPGLTVVMPSTPSDAYGLLRSAVRDPNPVIFIENRLQYGQRGAICDPEHLVPIGQAAIRREGTDVTIVSYSRMVHEAVKAADILAEQGISCEVIDLRTISPLDTATVLASVKKTSRLVIAHEASVDFGVGAEIAARIADEGIWHLDAPIGRVGAQAVPAPYAPILESHWLPDHQNIVQTTLRVVLA